MAAPSDALAEAHEPPADPEENGRQGDVKGIRHGANLIGCNVGTSSLGRRKERAGDHQEIVKTVRARNAQETSGW